MQISLKLLKLLLPICCYTHAAPVDPICINFQYGIENDDGLTADDILNGFNNTFMNDLIIATRDTAIQILNETLPQTRQRRGLRQDAKLDNTNPHLGIVSLGHYEPEEIISRSVVDRDKTMNSRRKAMYVPINIGKENKTVLMNSNNRRLAFYSDSKPPVITNVIDNDFCPDADEGINCAIVESWVCVFLEVGDNEEEVKEKVLEGFRNAFQNGSFQNAIPGDDDIS